MKTFLEHINETVKTQVSSKDIAALDTANTTDLKELPGAAGQAAHAKLHKTISKILKKTG